MSKRDCFMLKIIWIFLLILSGCSMAESFEWRVKYDPGVMPSCIIYIDTSYWEWRTLQGHSEDVVNDLNKLYSYYIEAFETNKHNSRLSNDEAVCNGKFLMAPELARVMNFYGENAFPISFYHELITVISELGPEYQYRALNISEFEDVVKASIRVIESRFLDEG